MCIATGVGGGGIDVRGRHALLWSAGLRHWWGGRRQRLSLGSSPWQVVGEPSCEARMGHLPAVGGSRSWGALARRYSHGMQRGPARCLPEPLGVAVHR